MDYKEISGKSFEDAISEACETFGVTSDDIEYEIVDMGTTGFLGIGSKPTVIRARVKEEALKKKEISSDEEKTSEKNSQENKEVKKEAKETKKEEKKESIKEERSEKAAEKKEKKQENLPEVDGEKVCDQAKEFLSQVFKAMEIDVTIDAKYDAENRELNIDLAGKEMGVLIGKRGQTLDSLQYLVSLVVNRENYGYIRVKVDTEDYRQRRKATLENLAKNLAFKVKRTKRPVTLEPMNPYERRVIHSAIQSDRYVTTHSEGEEPYRRVVITLK
ncbi:MAG: protein jag [Lachnospiraceae bacterium]|nr:protein jag [Lachnospiraceae bacterium]